MAVTLEGIRLLLDQQKEQLVIEINTKFDELKADIEMVRLAAERAESLAKANQNEIDEMKSEIAKLNDANTHLNALLDDQINRNMRTTLIFKGIKEEKDEGWEQTEDRLVDVLSRHLNLNKDNLKGMIERAHRGKHSPSSTSSSPRHIYAKFSSWKHSELIKDKFFQLQRNHPKIGIRVEQMYSQSVTSRRNEALQVRRNLLDSKSIVAGYVRYPATLVVKKSKNEKYSVFKSY